MRRGFETNEDFFDKFRTSPSNTMNKENDVIRTPSTGRPLNSTNYTTVKNALMSKPDKKVKKKKKKMKKKKKKKSYMSLKEGFNITNDGLMSTIIDAVIGAVLLFVVTSSPIGVVISKFIRGFYTNVENKYIMNNGSYDAGNLPGTVVIKSDRIVSLKGKLILMGLYVVLFMIIKTWFIVES